MSDWLVETLAWTSALMLLVLLVRGPVAARFGARVAYALWLLPAARFFLPTFETVVEREVAAPPLLPAATPAAGQEAALADAFIVAAMRGPEAAAMPDGSVLLLALWGLGAAATWLVHQWRYRRHRDAILTAAHKVGHVGGIDLMVSPAAPGPMAFGTLRRVIALPQHYIDRCSEAELDLALEHERSHHRSGDLIARQLGLVFLSLHWFNPIAWKAYAAFQFDQEAACDARVLARRGPEARADYGRAIAKSAAPARLLFANARDTRLKRRLKMMTNPAHRPAAMVAMLALGALLLPATASRAVSVVDVPAAAPAAPASPAPTAPIPAAAPTTSPVAPAPVAPLAARGLAAAFAPAAADHSLIDSDTPYSAMSERERADFDRALGKMREALAELRAERARMRQDLAADLAQQRAQWTREREEMRADLAQARREIAAQIAEVDAQAGAMRAAGEDPELVKAGLRAAQQSLDAMDIEAIVEAAMSSVDPELVDEAMTGAEAGLRSAIADMEARRNR
ncbi:M56 family metallopeptidase [Sphingomicrobium astaxanthinifaciens]|uniref:M56 family metallopeptidase n=1 Tax=Sphingomicrobium astaxanthinifaciens TaxID=1227949 RepID=UPI001FCAD356|nr:M56 family metallopeptidase [Sphingomicrobium astaxanthinifaciens]MCJ7421826.1 hypothetical protein [Sphingomicrobium astaxanthinifaciens]